MEVLPSGYASITVRSVASMDWTVAVPCTASRAIAPATGSSWDDDVEQEVISSGAAAMSTVHVSLVKFIFIGCLLCDGCWVGCNLKMRIIISGRLLLLSACARSLADLNAKNQTEKFLF